MRLKITLFLFMSFLWLQHTSAQCSGVDFEERNGIAILEMEEKTAGSFRNEALSGASGGRGIAYRGSNSFGTPGNSTINYSLRISSPGTYRFIWRNKIGVIASHNASTEHNDAWLKITGGNVLFFGAKGSASGSRIYPGGSGRTPTPNGASSGGWFKVYTNIIDWNWDTWTSDHDGHFVYANFPSAGTYTVQVSGRSNGHFIDRMVLYKEGSYSNSQARSLARAQTDCSGGGSTPPPPPPPPANNVPPTVSFTNLNQSFTEGSNISIGLSSNDSDGSVTRHQIFVNGALVDTDGASYSPYVISNASEGDYTIRATVTDNSGASTSATTSITVGSGGGSTPPPPPPPPSGGNAAPTVSFTNLSNGQQITAGSSISVGLSSNDSDGNVVRHQIFVNGALVDTDGSSYTPHPISNIQPGSYSIRAVVTDNDGATAESTINISVGGSVAPPPPPPSGGNSAPTVSFTNLTEGQQVSVGSTVSVGLSANDTDGNVVRYQIYVNGSLVDTDGATYTPHPIRNIPSGNYEIRATVTDNDGATATTTVNISAGSGTTPPPPPPAANQISFNLVNASTNNTIGSLTNGSTLNSAQGINIVANSPSSSNSVRLTLSGSQSASRVENVAPYALFGDINGDYFSGNLGNGNYTLRAIAYSGNGASGSIIADTTISFSVGSSAASVSVSSKAIAYPNPVKADGRVSIKLPSGSTGKFGYSVINSSGAVLETGQFKTESSENSVDLELNTVGAQREGVYYLTIISTNSKHTIPIIRE